MKAALPSVPVVNQLPGVKKASADGFAGLSKDRPPVTVERGHVDAYAAVCGFPTKDTVPLPYPHMLAFPLHMALMTDPAFPAPAIGTVHLENSITGHRPIAIGEELAVSASVGPAEAAPEGHDLPVRDRGARRRRPGVGEHVDVPPPRQGRRVGLERVDVPRRAAHRDGVEAARRPRPRYAAVSGDHNPIHLYPLTAKALGFPRQIAHGMWSKARCIAALENRLPDAVRVEVAFKKPIILPGKVAFGSTPTNDGYAFSLSNPTSGAPHLAGPPPRSERQFAGRRGRIRPSWATVATSVPSWVNTRPSERPRAPFADGDHWS